MNSQPKRSDDLAERRRRAVPELRELQDHKQQRPMMAELYHRAETRCTPRGKAMVKGRCAQLEDRPIRSGCSMNWRCIRLNWSCKTPNCGKPGMNWKRRWRITPTSTISRRRAILPSRPMAPSARPISPEPTWWASSVHVCWAGLLDNCWLAAQRPRFQFVSQTGLCRRGTTSH